MVAKEPWGRFEERVLSRIGEFFFESPQGCEKVYRLPHNTVAVLPMGGICLLAVSSDSEENLRKALEMITQELDSHPEEYGGSYELRDYDRGEDNYRRAVSDCGFID